MKIDNDRDGKDDIIFQFRFKTEIRLPGVFTALVGVGNGVNTPDNSPPPIPPGTPLIPPAITALDGPGSRAQPTPDLHGHHDQKRQEHRAVGGEDPVCRAVQCRPPHHAELCGPGRQGIYDLGNGVRVFAGTVDDPFYIDLGAAFDTLNFRPSASGVGVPGVLLGCSGCRRYEKLCAG